MSNRRSSNSCNCRREREGWREGEREGGGEREGNGIMYDFTSYYARAYFIPNHPSLATTEVIPTHPFTQRKVLHTTHVLLKCPENVLPVLHSLLWS